MSGHENHVDALEADIEQTREELAETVDLLAAKFDVKARVRDRVTTDDGKPKPVVLAAAGFMVAAVVAYVVLRRRRG